MKNINLKIQFLILWHQEYKIVSEQADIYLNDTLTNFQTVADNSTGDVLESLKQAQDILYEIQNSFIILKLKLKIFLLIIQIK